MLKSSVGSQYRIIWLYNSSADLRSRIDSKLQLGLLAIINRQSFHEERSDFLP
jgi:hypothetical protein